MSKCKQHQDKSSVCYTLKMAQKSRVFISPQFFTYKGPGKPGNSLYLCLSCPPKKPEKFLSCSDISKINLKKHMEVSSVAHCSLTVKFYYYFKNIFFNRPNILVKVRRSRMPVMVKILLLQRESD